MKLIHFLMPEELIQRIDNFRFAHRFGSRAAAIRALLEHALDDLENLDEVLASSPEYVELMKGK